MEQASQFDGTHPDSWNGRDKPVAGAMLIGQVMRYDQFEGQDGPVAICVVLEENTGKEWGVWVSGDVLRDLFELHRPRVGERIWVKRVQDKVSKAGRPYKIFGLGVDRPEGYAPESFGGRPTELQAREALHAEAGTTMSQPDANGAPDADVGTTMSQPDANGAPDAEPAGRTAGRCPRPSRWVRATRRLRPSPMTKALSDVI